MSSTDLPLDALGPTLARFAREVSEETSTPVEMTALMGLGVLSTAALGKAVVQMKHSWTEHLGVWSVTIAESGERKSAVLRHVARPLRRHEAARRDAESEQFAAERRRVTSRRKRAEKLETKVANAKPGTDLQMAELELAEWAREIADDIDPVEYRLLVDDITPEALAGLLEDHPALGFISDEAGPLEALAHAPSDRLARLDIYLKAYDGAPHTVHRVGRDPEYVDEPLIAFAVSVQPVVARAVMSDERLERRGALSRFLWCQPESMVGYRKDPEERVLTDKTLELWDGLVQRLLELPQPKGREDRPVMALDPSAGVMLEAYGDQIETQLRPGGRLSEIATWAGKERGRAGRLAGLLHLVDGNEPATPISLSTVERAIEVGQWSIEEALRLFGEAKATTSSTAAEELVTRRLESWARENVNGHGQPPLILGELYPLVKGVQIPDRGTLDFVLGELETQGVLTVDEIRSSKKGGRPGHNVTLSSAFLRRIGVGE